MIRATGWRELDGERHAIAGLAGRGALESEAAKLADLDGRGKLRYRTRGNRT